MCSARVNVRTTPMTPFNICAKTHARILDSGHNSFGTYKHKHQTKTRKVIKIIKKTKKNRPFLSAKRDTQCERIKKVEKMRDILDNEDSSTVKQKVAIVHRGIW